jgi:hypothetical protein
MANKYGIQYTKAYVDVPSSKIDPGAVSGEVKSMYMSYLGSAELATTDTLYLGKLPAGARVLEAKVRCPATGATGIFDIGYQANGVDSADLDAFVVGADPGAAAVYAAGAGAGLGKKFTVETTIVLTPTEVTASFTGKTVEFWISYVVA